MAVSDLFKWNLKGQKLIIPLVDSSEYTCWGETLVCERLNDPTDPTFIREMEYRRAKMKEEEMSLSDKIR